LLPEVARTLGLRPGIPVSPAIHDQYASALGSGVVHAGDILFGARTAWILLAVQDRLAEPVTDEAFVCHHVVEGLFGQIVSLRNGGSAFQWGLQLLGWEPLSRAEIDLRLQSAPAGCGGLVCRPLFGAFDVTGLPAGMRGGFEGLQLGHTPAHLLRAILEGLAFELHRHLGFLRQAGLPVQRLVMAGGAAKSEVTPQLIADVTGVPLTCLTEGEGSLRGALVLARSLLPDQGSLRALADEMAPGGRVVKPGADHGVYQEQFKKYLQCALMSGIFL
jgi:sugar (pentulose or hexulose) kinase